MAIKLSVYFVTTTLSLPVNKLFPPTPLGLRRFAECGRRRCPKSIVLLSLLALSAAVSGCAKARLDSELERLCHLDGGIHIYETVALPDKDFGPSGEVFPQYWRLLPTEGSNMGPDFTALVERTEIVSGNPKLTRTNLRIVRNSDGKTLSSRITYSRFGGDVLPTYAEPSRKTCVDVLPPGTYDSFEQRTFTRKEK